MESMRIAGRLGTLTLALIAYLMSYTLGYAQPAAQFYLGKQVKLVTGSPPGDSYDVWARILARHMSRHIPGEPTIIVQNMPGGGTLIAANWLYTVAPKDGTVFGTFSRNLPAQAVLGRPNFNFDPRKFGWLGSPETVNRVCIANTNANVQNASELFTKELLVGGGGAGEVTTFLPTLFNKLLGTKFKLVDGYKGTGGVLLAMERGEVEGTCMSMSQLSGPRRDLLDNNKVRILFSTETKPLAEFPTVPTIYQFVKTSEQRQILGFINSSLEFGRPFMAPPDVPADRLDVLRRAFAETVKDPAFLAETAQRKYTVTYTPPQAIYELLDRMYATPKALLDEAATMMPTGD
jgi:tripartite-type tricarboxylate transporter receptor subunit TctC